MTGKRESLPRHEATDASPRTLGALAAAIAILVVLGIGAGVGTVRRFSEGTPRAPAATSFANGPHLRPGVDLSWEQCERESAAHLDGYSWVDRRGGTVRIPLERAMDLVAGEAGEDRK